jgi:hypothetical protein
MLRAGFQPDGTPLPPEKGPFRTLPWRVAINKHIDFPSSFMAALADTNLNKLVLVDNAGGKGEDYVMAETCVISDERLRLLEQAQEKGALLKTLQEENLLPSGSKAEALKEDNIGFLAVRVSGRNRVLVIRNLSRMIDVIEKGQLNPNAHGPENLTLVKRNASFVIDRIDKPDGISMVPESITQQYLAALAGKPDAPVTRPNYIRLNKG